MRPNSRPRRANRVRAIALAVGLAAIALVGVTPPSAQAQVAVAEAPLSKIDRVADAAGVLNEVQYQDLKYWLTRAAYAQGYVAYVKDFDSLPPNQWCEQSFNRAGLPDEGVLLAVATQGRQYIFCQGSAQMVGSADGKKIDAAVRAQLSGNNWYAAGEAFAKGLLTEAQLRAYENRKTSPAPSNPETDSTTWFFRGLILTLLAPFLLVLAVIVAVVLLVKKLTGKRRGQGAQMPPGPVPLDPNAGRDPMRLAADQLTPAEVEAVLAKRVVAADDALRSAREDLEFLGAELGADAADRFRPALAEAAAGVSRAMEALDRAQQASNPAERDRLGREAIAAADRVHAAIDAHAVEFQQLRESRRSSAADFTRLEGVVADLRAQLQPVELELSLLATSYPHTDLSSILDNPDQARNLLDAASQQLQVAKNLFDQGRAGEAAAYLALVERAVAQTRLLNDAVLQAHRRLANIDAALLASIAAISEVIQAGRNHPRAAAFAALVSAAEDAVTFAQGARAGSQDPLLALERLATAEQVLAEELTRHGGGMPLERANNSERSGELIELVEGEIEDVNQMIQLRRGMVSIAPRRTLELARGQLDNARNAAGADQRFAAALAAQKLVREARAQIDAELVDAGRSYRPAGTGRIGTDMMWPLLLGGMFGSQSSRAPQQHDTWGGFDTSFGGSFGGGSFGGGSSGGGGSFGGGSF